MQQVGTAENLQTRSTLPSLQQLYQQPAQQEQ